MIRVVERHPVLGRSGKKLSLRPLPLRAASGPGDRCGISLICLGSPEPDPAPNRHRALATHSCRSVLAWTRMALMGVFVATQLGACATGGADWRVEPPGGDVDLLAEHLGLPRLASVEVGDDGAGWIALGAPGRRIARWEGVPAGLPCAEVPLEPQGAHWQVRGVEPPALLRLDADGATVWAMDSAQACVVAWELFVDADPEGEPVLELTIEENAEGETLGELPDDAEDGALDGAGDALDDALPEEHREADLTSAPGLERVSLDLDRIEVTGQDGTVLLEIPLGIVQLDPEMTGARTVSLDVERLAPDRIVLRYSLDEATNGYDDSAGSTNEAWVQLWEASRDEPPEELSNERGWSRSEGAGTCAGSSDSEGAEQTRRIPVPAGVLIHESASETLSTTADVCDDSGAAVCSVTAATDTVSWCWALELPDGSTEELGTGETESSSADSSGCSP